MKRSRFTPSTCLLPIALVLPMLALAAKPGAADASQAAQKTNGKTPFVLICGTGVSPHYETIVDQLMDSLAESKVSAKNTDQHEFGRSTCVEKAKEAGAGSLLYVAINVSEKLAYETTVSLQCVTVDGTKLWEESQKGPFMSMSVDSTISKILAKIKPKLQAHVGQPGLPTTM